MRNQIAAAFVLLTIAVLGLFVGMRVAIVGSLIEDNVDQRLQEDAGIIASYLASQADPDHVISEAQAKQLVGSQQRLVVTFASGLELSAQGPRYQPEEDQPAASKTVAGIQVDLAETKARAGEAVKTEARAVMIAVGVLVVFAALLGIIAGTVLVRPLDRLRESAGALGRGRFDLDLDGLRYPEAREIGAALQSSATRLRDSIEEDREYAQDFSHRVQTPLAGARMELEELERDPELDPRRLETVKQAIELVDRATLQLRLVVGAAKHRPLVKSSQEPLEQVAHRLARRWDAYLKDKRIKFHHEAFDELDVLVTPGPIEQVADAALDQLLASASGPVELGVEELGDQIHLRYHGGTPREEATVNGDALEEVLEILGGRSLGSAFDAGGIRIWLPRR